MAVYTGYPSRMRVGRGSDEIDQLGSWAGAVTPKPPVNAEKAKCHRSTNRPTDRVGCRVACTRLKKTTQTVGNWAGAVAVPKRMHLTRTQENDLEFLKKGDGWTDQPTKKHQEKKKKETSVTCGGQRSRE